MPASLRSLFLMSVAVALMAMGCVSVPAQVAQTHHQEKLILEALQTSHLAMVDAFVEKKRTDFDRLFFDQYAPAFASAWRAAFEEAEGRPYDPERDHAQFHSDLVAVYQLEVQPIDDMRLQLRDAISAEYGNALAAHQAVGRWIDSVEDLNSAQRQAFDEVLAALKPGLSLDRLDDAVAAAKSNVKAKIEELTEN